MVLSIAASSYMHIDQEHLNDERVCLGSSPYSPISGSNVSIQIHNAYENEMLKSTENMMGEGTQGRGGLGEEWDGWGSAGVPRHLDLCQRTQYALCES